MLHEAHNPYKTHIATVIGGDGKLGRKIVNRLGNLGFEDVRVLERGDKAKDHKTSTYWYSAVDADTTVKLFRRIKKFLTADSTVLDGASVKTPHLIAAYRRLDSSGVSTASTHLGVHPEHPWEGAPVWIAPIGEHSERAKKLAVEIFAPQLTSINFISIEDHKKVEIAQSLTIIGNHIIGDTLAELGMTLDEFYQHAPLTAGLASLVFARVYGQGSNLSSEIVHEQAAKKELVNAFIKSAKELKRAQRSRRRLRDWMSNNEKFHDGNGVLQKVYDEAGVVAARRQNLQLEHIRFTIPVNKPGELVKYLVYFAELGMDLTAIDSMPVQIADGRSIRFDIGIHPQSTNPEKMEALRGILVEHECLVE
jgi:prephenate dehydrogenase